MVPPGERVLVVEAGLEQTWISSREGARSRSASDREQVSPHVRSNTGHCCVCRVTDVCRVTSALQRCPACGLLHVAGWGAVCCSWGCPGHQSHGLLELLSPPVSGGCGAQAGPGSAPLTTRAHGDWAAGPARLPGGPGCEGWRWPCSLWVRGGLGKELPPRKRQQIAVRA